MFDTLLTLAASLCNLLGFALLALSQQRHAENVAGKNSSITTQSHIMRAQRAIGFIAISLSLPTCIMGQGASFGSLLWSLLVCASALAVALTLTWRPHTLHVLHRLIMLCKPSHTRRAHALTENAAIRADQPTLPRPPHACAPAQGTVFAPGNPAPFFNPVKGNFP